MTLCALLSFPSSVKSRSVLLTSLALRFAATATAQTQPPPDKVFSLLNGKELSGFGASLVGFVLDDAETACTVVDQINRAPASRLSSQHYGGIVTKERHTNYRLVVEFHGGLTTWEPRKNKNRESGILLHGEGAFGNYQDDSTAPWTRSVEYQIIKCGSGDIILVQGYDSTGGMEIPPELATTDGKTSKWNPAGTPGKVAGRRIDWHHKQMVQRLPSVISD